MTQYAAYLEIRDDGLCLAHVLSLPGFVLRATTRDEALRLLPETIRDHHAWLRRHGEPAPPADDPIEVEIAEESVGSGPFEPGNTAALFAPDREPISSEEMEDHFHLMGHTRADLLALVRDLAAGLLDWKPNPHSFDIRGLLRHVGNAEEWYVSRLVPPETLPPEWADDEKMPIFEFLAMSRRTAVERLRQLTEAERAEVHYPTGWTNHPDEPWTARKALRRFLEHEREHTNQVREILEARRNHLLDRLAAERAELLAPLIGLDTEAVETPITETWAVKEMLAHVAGWDRWTHRIMMSMVAGEEPDFSATRDIDAINAAFVAPWQERDLAAVVTELQQARVDWTAWLLSLPVEAFFQPRIHAGDNWVFSSTLLPGIWQHDAEHARQIAAWREIQGFDARSGPKAILIAGLEAARTELLTAAALIPAGERDSQPVVGEWTLKDLLGHVADWEWLDLEGLRHMAARQPPQVEHVTDLDAWNAAHVAARCEQTWDAVWSDLHAARHQLLETLGNMSDAVLARSYPFPWGVEGTAYEWARIILIHSRGHARELRESFAQT